MKRVTEFTKKVKSQVNNPVLTKARQWASGPICNVWPHY